MRIGIVGGTGPLGRGLALRLAASAFEVVLGSRDEQRGASAAGELEALLHEWQEAAGATEPAGGANARGATVSAAARAPMQDAPGSVEGGSNEKATESDLVFLTTPWEGCISTARGLRKHLAGKTVVSTVNALVKEGRELHALLGPRGSMGAWIQATLPDSGVVVACNHLPAAELLDPTARVEADVFVCGDARASKEAVIEALSAVHGLRLLDVGSLSQAGALEAMTAVLVNLNIRYGGAATIGLRNLYAETV